MAKTEDQKAAEKAAKDKERADALVAELATFGITSTSGTETIAPLLGTETAEKLAEILKQAKVDKKASEKAAASSDPITVKYRDHKGEPIDRAFSKEIHGEDFAKLADEFKVTNAQNLIA